MTVQDVVDYILKYGIPFLFLIIYLEYLNLPALPAAVVFPAIGVMAAQEGYNLFGVFLISLAAGILGSLTLYLIGYYVGNAIIRWIRKKFPKSGKYIDKIIYYSEKYGNKGVFICRLLPGVRTIVSLVSGALREEVIDFVLYSALGIAIWNFVFIFGGYITTRAIL